MNQSLYFIAIIPPRPLLDSIQVIRHDVATRFGSLHALRSPPHITLRMPFQMDESMKTELDSFLNLFAKSQSPFEVTLQGFGRFFEKVIFIEVLPNQSLQVAHSGIADALRQFGIQESPASRPFRTHVTVAHRDLKPAEFRRAWKEFENKVFEARFEAGGISLLRHHPGGWEVVGTFSFWNA